MLVLFIGGNNNGKKIDVQEPLAQYYSVSKPLHGPAYLEQYIGNMIPDINTVFNIEEYRLEKIYGNTQTFYVYVHESIRTANEVIAMLLEGYEESVI